MGFFSLSKKNTESEAEKARNESPGLLWIQTVSDDVYQQTLDNLVLELEELEEDYPSFIRNQRIISTAELMLKKMVRVDRSRLTAYQEETLGRIVFATLPEAYVKLETGLFSPHYRSQAAPTYAAVLKTTIYIVDQFPRKLPIPKPTAESKELAQKTVKTLGTKESEEKLRAVQALASKAFEVAQSMEDKFFAEQSLNSYLPDSVRIFTGLINAPEDMKADANILFVRQLEILESQLNAVIRRASHNGLAEMQAHTEFLETKRERLALESSKNK